MVDRLFVEKKPGFDNEARALLKDARSFLGVTNLTGLRLFNRYDVEGLDAALLAQARDSVFSEPQLDDVYDELPQDEGVVFATEYLPGQFDQRADSAAQCIQLMAQCERPIVRTALVYILKGDLSDEDVETLKKHVINPVERREASLEKPETLRADYALPETVAVMEGFTGYGEAELDAFRRQYGLAMDDADLAFCQKYFQSERRDPTLTEIRMIDTYWSDHCRHTTFLTEFTDVRFDDARVEKAYGRYLEIRAALKRSDRPVTLMDMATVGARYLKLTGALTDLDESEEINACTVKLDVETDKGVEKWLLLFKNETHNHPTEIEPFGGAATCIGGAIRDPLSGRGYVYQAMRVTGAADPTQPVENTIEGKLPQRMLTTTAAAGYSSYGNQIGLATGLVDEIYHPGYAAKRMEIGAVVGAAPAKNVRRETPAPGDCVVLLGGRTGRDGCGGATGSSKSHTAHSLETCGAEVQKGNAPEERKLQRLFRNPEAARRIKRCNDFGAGGVSVAIGELADGLSIDLNAVPRKYDGLDGTELAISESQERMAVVLAPEDVDAFMALAHEENLEATVVAKVTEEKRLVMRWNGRVIVDVSREFLNSNGAPKQATALVEAQKALLEEEPAFADGLRAMAGDLNMCSRRGLCERFDSTNGAMSLLMPFGGKRQLTPAQAMASLLPVRGAESKTASVMAYGFDPFVMEKSPYVGAYLSVVSSMAKLVACGAGWRGAHLTFQEYFQRMTGEAEKWGRPMAALLGALMAQLDLEAAAIGGKDSMSGSFEQMHVPPTLVSFAVAACRAENIVSNEFKRSGADVGLLLPEYGEDGLPVAKSLRALFDHVTELIRKGEIVSAQALGMGGAAEAVFKMGLGNRIGFAFDEGAKDLFKRCYGGFVVEYAAGAKAEHLLGRTTEDYALTYRGERVDCEGLESIYDAKLEDVFPVRAAQGEEKVEAFRFERNTPAKASVKIARPRVLIPVFPGTNCEYDTERAFQAAGAETETIVVRNLSAKDVQESVEAFAQSLKQAQIVFIPGGFSGGDEPDGSGKFITAFFRNPAIREGVMELLKGRDGLMGGICNGFQALIKLGLVPYGEIREPDASAPTLTFNVIGRHQSRIVRTRVASTLSPWLMHARVGDIHIAPISHGEGRFIADMDTVRALAKAGQIATQYVNAAGEPTMDIDGNPNGSVCAIEGITSPDGRVFGRMAHAERTGAQLYRNVPGDQDSGIFRGAVDYFRD